MLNRSLYFLFLLYITFSIGASAQTVDPNFVDGVVEFKLNDNSSLELDPYTNNVPAINLIYTLYGVDTLFKPYKLPGTPLDKIYRIEFSNINSVGNLITDLELIPDVEFAEKMPLYQTTLTPNDFNAGNQWALNKINAEEAWDFSTGSGNVVIAIVDNGVKHSHEDLVGNRWVNSAEQGGLPLLDDDGNGYADDIYGYDVADGDVNPEPPSSIDNSSPFIHGTHVAGIAAAATNNNTGIASIGYNCRFMPVKCTKDNSNGQSLTNAHDGIFYAMRSGADIINMSFASPENSSVFQLVIDQAYVAGVVLIGAAGNDNTNTQYYPAAYSNVISVGATDENDSKAGFSNYGNWVDVMAPGTSIYSTMPQSGNTYENKQGTSMAAPLVAGLAGLILSDDQGLSPSQVKDKIIGGCENIDGDNPNYAGQLGAGRINAWHSFSPLSVEEHKRTGAIIYPNPVSTNSKLGLIFKQPLNEALDYTIQDAMGKQVDTGRLKAGAVDVFIGNYDPGIYVLRYTLDGKSQQKKFIIQ